MRTNTIFTALVQITYVRAHLLDVARAMLNCIGSRSQLSVGTLLRGFREFWKSFSTISVLKNKIITLTN